jgi:hypothetical protein
MSKWQEEVTRYGTRILNCHLDGSDDKSTCPNRNVDYGI